MEGVATVEKVRNVVSPQYALLAKGTFQFTIYNVTFGKSNMADNRPHRSRRFIYQLLPSYCNQKKNPLKYCELIVKEVC